MKAIVIREFGGPEVLKWEEVPTPTPGRHSGWSLFRRGDADCPPLPTCFR